ncbi:MAG: NADH-quinone oxidoreductase subunit H [bacterium]
MNWEGILIYAIALAAAPLLVGVINRTKAYFAGRCGQPLLQTYHDLAKLLRKGAVYSGTTTWVFRAGPIISLGAALLALAFIPLGGIPALFSFNGDFILVAYLLGVMRFFTVAAALDTGSSFEGMGASREVQFAAMAEPSLILGVVAVARGTGELTLTNILGAVSSDLWLAQGTVLALVIMAWFAVFLAENSRIPVDDPNTHLELTMIHEVMVLDHGGPDFAFVSYGAALKMWILGAFVVGLLAPVRTGQILPDLAAGLAGMLTLAVAVGVVESTMARLRLVRVPHLLLAAGAFSILALLLVMR